MPQVLTQQHRKTMNGSRLVSVLKISYNRNWYLGVESKLGGKKESKLRGIAFFFLSQQPLVSPPK